MPSEPRVLVVDDNEVLRFALRHGLAAEGFAVDEAPDAREACARAAEERPDVVLLDWALADEHGPTACRKLLEAHPGAAVVMYTGYEGGGGDRHEAFAAGASAFLNKGMDLAELAAALRRVLAGRG